MIINELKDEINQSKLKGVQGTPLIEINGIQYMGLSTYDEIVERVHNMHKRIEAQEKREKGIVDKPKKIEENK